MSLIYIGSGERNYDKNPIRPYARQSWEIFAVVEGRVRLWLPDNIQPVCHRTLWVFPPAHMHGWLGYDRQKAEVILFHLEDLCEPVSNWVRHDGFLTKSLSSQELGGLKSILLRASLERAKPTLLRELRWKSLALGLGIFIGEMAIPSNANQESHSSSIVQKAMGIFAEHVHEGWTFEQVCECMSISTAHLRRHFYSVLRMSPRKVFEDIRFRRAVESIASPDTTLETVAIAMGYQSLAAFSRAFKRQFGVSPNQWRSN